MKFVGEFTIFPPFREGAEDLEGDETSFAKIVQLLRVGPTLFAH